MFALIVILSLIVAAPFVVFIACAVDKAAMLHFEKYGNDRNSPMNSIDVSKGHW